MSNTIYYFTGTGNSLSAARGLASALGETDALSIAGAELPGQIPDCERIGLVFPVYIWGVPTRVLRFIDCLAGVKADYIFAVAVNAGQVAGTLLELGNAFAAKGLSLSSGFSLEMPSNYIPWGGPGPLEKQKKTFAAAEAKLSRIADAVRKKQVLPVEKGPLWQRLVFTMIHRMSVPHIPEMDKSFFADDACNTCGICVKVCPSANIDIKDKRPEWKHSCEQCFACLQWCPQEAIQFEKRTKGRQRYRHPGIKLKDIIDSRSGGSHETTPRH